MKLRYWIIIEVICGIILGIFGGIIKNDSLLSLGMCGIILPLFHNLFGSAFYEEYKLKKENKYARGILCSNCQEYNWFKIPIGKCIPEFLIDMKCRYCYCELKLSEASMT